MTEFSPDRFYQENFQGLPEFKRPQIRSLVVSLIASLHEIAQDTDKASDAWEVSNAFLKDAVSANPEEAFKDAVTLITLPEKPENKKYEHFRRYLIGNGLTILVDNKVHNFLTAYLKNGEKKEELVQNIKAAQLFNVKGFDKARAFSTPEAFNLFAAVGVGITLSDERGAFTQELAGIAIGKLKETSSREIINIFVPLKDSKPISEALAPFLG